MILAALAFAPATAFAEAPVVSVPAATPGQMAPAGGAQAGVNSSAAAVATPAYVEQAAMSDLFEIESSKLALEKSKNAGVKSFAKMMVSAHTKTTAELTAAVKAENINVPSPTKLDAAHADKLAGLKQLSGAQFDKAYMDAQVEGHQAALKLHRDYAASGDNAKLKTWAGKTAEAVQMHLTKAESLDKTVGES